MRARAACLGVLAAEENCIIFVGARGFFFPSQNFETDDLRNALAIHHIAFFIVLGP